MASTSTDLIVPKLGESITEAVVAKWLKKVGEATAIDEPLVDLETDKVSVTLPAPTAGVLSEQRVPAGTTVKVGDVIGIISAGKAAAAPQQGAVAPQQVAPQQMPVAAQQAPVAAQQAGAAQSKPSVAERGAQALAAIAATQPAINLETANAHGRTLPPSLRKALFEHEGKPEAVPQLASSPTAQTAPVSQAQAPVASPTVGRADEEVVAMTPLRKRIAERLVQAQHTAAILTTTNEVDMSGVMALRERFGESFLKKHGVKLGFMSFFVKACVESLKEFPGVNAEVRGTDIIYKKHYDFGIAVGGGRGLVVPVVRNVDRLSFAEIERTVGDLGQRAKDNKLTLDELAGGTFSITNGGVYGSLWSTPLLNLPQSGILGMHNIVKRPIAVGDQVVIRPMMYIALSYDHRVVDGREAVQFLVGVKQRVESPERMLFSV